MRAFAKELAEQNSLNVVDDNGVLRRTQAVSADGYIANHVPFSLTLASTMSQDTMPGGPAGVESVREVVGRVRVDLSANTFHGDVGAVVVALKFLDN